MGRHFLSFGPLRILPASLSDAAYTALSGSVIFAGTAPTGTYGATLPTGNLIGGYFDLGGSLEVEFNYTPAVSSVPEPTTVIAGALMLLPFGASTMRSLRKKRAS